MPRRCFCVAVLGCAVANMLSAADYRVGTAAVDITPPMGIPMAGYYHARGADGVLDPLHSKALVIEADGERAALVVLDIIGVTRTITDQARAEIEKTTGIKADHVMVSATHTHTGPELANRTRRSASQAQDKQREMMVDYTEGLPKLIAQSVVQANASLKAASLQFAKGRCENVGFNRRYYMRDGTVGWNPGKLNPKVVMPAGRTDPEVNILYVGLDAAFNPTQSVATYVNFAMHPDTTSGSKLSADWPGALGRVLASYHGSNHLTIVANGTCGNVNHVDTNWKAAGSGPYEQNRIATLLGATVFQAYKELKLLPPTRLRARNLIVELALPEITAEQLEDARQTIAQTKDDRGTNFMKLVRSYRALDVASRQGKPQRAEVQVIALGDQIAWVGLPGEIFAELGLAIKKHSPFAQTFVVELANESLGYIPDRRSYAEGNYEPESSRCAPGSGEKLAETALNLLTALYQEGGGAAP